MARIPLIFPFGGLSDAVALTAQPDGTTRDSQNMRARDCTTGRMTGAQRAGLAKHTPAAIEVGQKIQHLAEISYDARTTTYASLGDTVTTDWSSATPSVQDSRNGVTDRYGNVYALDGNASVVKTNPDGRVIWKLKLPTKDPNHVCRALAVDDANANVVVAVSSGGDMKKAAIWCYEQIKDDKTDLLWEEIVAQYTEEIAISDSALYCAQNDTEMWESRMAVYVGLGVKNPTLIRQWDLNCYPVNGVAVSLKDGTVFTCHEPNTSRGLHPNSPNTTARLVDWTPKDLDNYARRAWTWLDSEDIDADETFNAGYDDGETVLYWSDKTDNFRGAVGGGTVAAPVAGTDTGGIVRKNVVAGTDTIFLNGTSNHFEGAAGISIDPAFKELNRGLLPTYTGAQFALFMTIRIPPEADGATQNKRWILSQNSDDTDTNWRWLFANRNVGDTLPGTTKRGNLALYEDSTTADGTNGHPHPGVWDDDGLMLITYIYDGGIDDVVSVPTRSTLRVNGRPVDRWHSKAITSLLECMLGVSLTTGNDFSELSNVKRMVGDFMDFFVLSDWMTTNSDISTPFTQQRLITTPTYPDSVWSANGDSELERLEGYFASKRGFSHKLPAGFYNRLEATAIPANGDTVTIDAVTYTFLTTLTGTANQVLRVTDEFVSLTNLMHAINGTGNMGVEYTSATSPHPNIRAIGVPFESGASDNVAIYVTSRNAYDLGFNCSETSAVMAWDATAAIDRSTVASSTDVGHYPHPFFLLKTNRTSGGPPHVNGAAAASIISNLKSPYGVLAAWDGASGALLGCITSNFGNNGIGIGGIGYGVRVNSVNEVYNMGPRQAVVVTPAVLADNTDIRKIVWNGPVLGFSTTITGATATSPWQDQVGAALTDHWPRMAVDKFDNVFCPIYQAAPATTMIGYARAATTVTGSTNGLEIVTVTTLTDDPKAHWVAVDPNYPDFAPGFASSRPEFVIIGTEQPSSSNTLALYKLRLVSEAQANVSQRTKVRVAVVNGSVYTFTSAGSTVLAASTFDAGARFISSCSIYSKWFATDGRSYRYYEPRDGTFGFLRSRSPNQIPRRGRLMAKCAGRLVIARFADSPQGWAVSAKDDPFNWDTDPPVQTVDQAIAGSVSPIGTYPDIITALMPVDDDNMYVGGDHTIGIIRGDPAAGGQIDQVSECIGVAFGDAWCLDPDGTLYFMANQGGLYRLPFGGRPRRMSQLRIERAISTIDLSLYRFKLAWNLDDDALHIFVIPYGSATVVTHYVWERANDAFWEDTYRTTGHQPTAVLMVDGDDPGDRMFLLGGADGLVRKWDPTANSDDGEVIDSHFMIGPLAPQTADYEVGFDNLEIALSSQQGGARVETYALTDPDVLGDPWDVADVESGHNPVIPVRMSGNYCAVRVRGLPYASRFAYERGSIEATKLGMMRVR